MEKNLTVIGIVQEGITIGLKNIASILGAVVLWALTIWIPYINVGTTIAIVSMPVALSKGNVMSPLEIFDPKYRKYMGEFFVTFGLMQLAIIPATLFMIIPGMVLTLAWSQAIFLVLDKGENPSEAISKSNEMTDGYKWTIFGGIFLIYLALIVVVYIFSLIHAILALIAVLALMPAFLGAFAHIYKVLSAETPVAPVVE
jgi:uncharacterized membrane protein